MPSSGIETAIRELEQEQKNIQDAISVLRRVCPSAGPARRARRKRGGKMKLSAAARKRISKAAKRRWAARRSAQG